MCEALSVGAARNELRREETVCDHPSIHPTGAIDDWSADGNCQSELVVNCTNYPKPPLCVPEMLEIPPTQSGLKRSFL